MGEMDEKITIRNVNVSGYSSKVSKVMYEVMLQAMWKVIPATVPGLTQTENRKTVVRYLSENLFPGGAKAEW